MAESAKGIFRPLHLGPVPREGLSLTLMAEAISKAPEPSSQDAEAVQPKSLQLAVPPGSPAPCSLRHNQRDTVPAEEQPTQPTPCRVPHPHPQGRGTPGPTRKRTEDNASGTEGTPPTHTHTWRGGGDSPQVPPPAPDKDPCRRVPLPARAPIPGPPPDDVFESQGAGTVLGLGRGPWRPCQRVGEREPPPGPSRSSLHSARASSLTLPR